MALDVNTVSYTYQKAGALTVAPGTLFFPVGRNLELVRIDALVGTAPTGTGSVTVAIRKNNVLVSGATAVIAVTTLAGFKVASLPVAQSGQNSTYANVLAPTVPNYTPLAVLAPADNFSVDVTVIGGTVAGSDLAVTLTFSAF